MLKGNFVLVGITFVFSARDYFIFIYVSNLYQDQWHKIGNAGIWSFEQIWDL